MRLESPEYLYLLLLLPAFFALRFYTFWKRRKTLRLLGDKNLVYKMMPELSLRRENIKFAVVLLIFTLLVLLLARPQMGTKMSKEERNGIEVMIAMDISNSMMAQDVAPSRLDKTKLLIENLVDHFTKDRVGMVVFAGDAFVQLPITNDYVSAKMFLQSINPSLIPAQGTNIAEALDLCMKSFTKQEKIGKAIILITDGEDHEGGAEEMAEEARKKGYNVFVLGVGTTGGAPVPDPDGGYMIDNEGNEVLSRLNEEMCRDIAQAGDGVYIHVENNNKAQELLNSHLARLQKGKLNTVVYSEWDEQFQALAIVILFLILLELLISDNANGLLTKLSRLANRQNSRYAKKTTLGGANKSLGSAKSLLVLFLLCLGLTSASAQSDRAFIRSGNKLYRQQKFDKAEIEYKKALERNEKNPEALYNMGCAKMMQDQDSLALNYFQKAAELQKDKKSKAQVYHNAGVILQNHKDYDQAIEAYKNSLRNEPNSIETKYNLELCKKLNKKQKKNDQNKDQDKDKKDDKKDQDKKDDKKNLQKQDDKKDQNKDQDKNKQDQQQNPQQNEQQKQQEENAEQLLNAAKMQEQATQEKVKRAMARQKSRSRLKNW